MEKKTQREVFSPGEFIREELEARGWTQKDLAAIMGRPLPTINEIITAKKAVTPETAIDLSKAFGTSAELWMNLESAYRLSLVASDDDDIARRAAMFKIAPVNEMVKRNWISGTDSAGALEKELLRFFDTASLSDKPTLTLAARKSTTYDAATPEQIAWACRVRNLAKAVSAAPFNPRSFEKGLDALRAYVGHEANVRKIPAFLASLGVRLVVVEYLPRMKMDGVTLWLNDKAPVVGLSMRFDRIDYFWFTLVHELIHVKYHDGFSFDERLAGEESLATSEKPEAEQRADTEATQFLVPRSEMDSFVARVAPLFYRPKINQFANRIKVHPGIIVGQLQRRGVLHYSQQRESLVKVRDMLIPNAMVDGWGFSPKL
ncbi:MAG TPA: HigA family addiction module antitoxin [Gemmataceae bacterium]|nr:HigA family addiction module antitoxin [Gemmataceae bacterium]